MVFALWEVVSDLAFEREFQLGVCLVYASGALSTGARVEIEVCAWVFRFDQCQVLFLVR